jgi:hypothetical protein
MKSLSVLLVALVLLPGCFLKLRPPGEEPSSEGTYDFVSINIDSSTFIEISMTGGYHYGGANPTRHDYEIRPDGKAVFRSRSMYTEDRTVEYDMPREQLERLAGRIIGEGFFEMRRLYDCDLDDAECKRRKRHYPPAVPLVLEVTIGNVSKKVEVTVFEHGMTDYPDGLEVIVNEIRGLFQSE